MQPLTVFGHWGGPNPWKVRIILEELQIPYDWHLVEFDKVKDPSYTKINPNGRLPAIQDPNTGVTLWESGAIILYLIEQYDKQGKLSYLESPKKFLTQQWLMFQVSGQGPYYGQAAWFVRFHPEKIQSASDRYLNETERIIGVLDTALQGKEWLVGDKCTYADLSFVTWTNVGEGLLYQVGKGDVLDKYPNYKRWNTALLSREVVKDAIEQIRDARAAHNLPR